MQRFKEFFLVTIGTFIMAVGFNSLFLANNIASGGISGLAISINKLFEINLATFVFIVNIPLLIACYVFLGRTTFLKTVYGSNIYPFFLKLTDSLPTLTKDPLLAALFGGIIVWWYNCWNRNWSCFSWKFFNWRYWNYYSNTQ